MKIQTLVLILMISACGSKDENPAAALADTATTQDNRGPKGDKGDKGDTGAQGPKGDTGSSGTSGAQGSTGAQGTAGTSSHPLNVINSSGATLGELWAEDSDGSLQVANGNLRMHFMDQWPNWPFPNAYLVFSGANCSGTSRLILLNGEFANVFVDGRDGSTLWAATGNDLGAFSYASRIAQSSSCSNTAGSTTRSWTTSTPSLGFSYPVTDPQIQN